MTARAGSMKTRNKSVFIMTSSGKPIYSNLSTEENMINKFSFLQAVISIVQSSNSEIRTLVAGQNKIVFLFRSSLYFICVSQIQEPEYVLVHLLDFLYQNILLILTSKVHDLIANNPAIDLTTLMGTDAHRLLSAAVNDCENTPLAVTFNALPGVLIADKSLKEDIASNLRHSVDTCGAA